MKKVDNKFARFVCATPHTEIVTLDQPLVDWLLSINTENRAIKPAVVNRYAAAIKAGEWEVTSQGMGISSDGVLLDGQHRLMALRACGYPPTQCVLVYGLNKSAQLKIDTHAKRAIADILSLAIGVASDHTRASAVRILAFVEDGVDSFTAAKTPVELVPVYERFRDSFDRVAYNRAVPGVNGAFIAACVYGVYCGIPPEYVQHFVDGYVSGENLRPGSPVLLLRDKSRSTRFGGSRAQQAWFGYSSRCLAAYIMGTDMKILQPVDPSAGAGYLRKAGEAYHEISRRAEVTA